MRNSKFWKESFLMLLNNAIMTLNQSVKQLSGDAQTERQTEI